MGAKMTCPYCNSKDTLKVVYSYRGHHIRNKQRNEYKKEEANALIKDGTIYRAERPKLVKYDFDGERLTATLYNKFCPNCNSYFHSISKMAVIDIMKVIFIYEINNNRYRYDFDFSDAEKGKYTYKQNYILVANNNLSSVERFNILKSIKDSKMNFWKKEYINTFYFNYRWIIKIEYNNGLSDCFFGYDEVSEKLETFISGFTDIIYNYDKKKEIDKILR